MQAWQFYFLMHIIFWVVQSNSTWQTMINEYLLKFFLEPQELIVAITEIGFLLL